MSAEPKDWCEILYCSVIEILPLRVRINSLSSGRFGFSVRALTTVKPPVIVNPFEEPASGLNLLFSSTLTSSEVSKEADEIFISIVGFFV